MAIEVPEDRIREFCEKHRIRKLSLFGSVLRDDFTPASDVDVLVELERGYCIGFIRLGVMEEDLSELLSHKVDLNTPGLISPYFRDEVLSEAEAVYDEA